MAGPERRRHAPSDSPNKAGQLARDRGRGDIALLTVARELEICARTRSWICQQEIGTGPDRILGVRCCHSLEFGQDRHFLKDRTTAKAKANPGEGMSNG